jgi:hypothetical protein
MTRKTSRVRMEFTGYWHWILSQRPCAYGITGKYLFFSKDQQRLIDIATREIRNHHFHKAKVNSQLLGESKEYVLCLYYKDDSRKHELARRCRIDYPDVKYRYWKSDESTLRGQYSPEFLSRLGVKERRVFTTPKRLLEFHDSKGKTILRQAAGAKVRRTWKRKTRHVG